jgi:hypothetical protein
LGGLSFEWVWSAFWKATARVWNGGAPEIYQEHTHRNVFSRPLWNSVMARLSGLGNGVARFKGSLAPPLPKHFWLKLAKVRLKKPWDAEWCIAGCQKPTADGNTSKIATPTMAWSNI